MGLPKTGIQVATKRGYMILTYSFIFHSQSRFLEHDLGEVSPANDVTWQEDEGITSSHRFMARPDFGVNSGGGGKKFREVQQSSSRPPWEVRGLRTGQSQRPHVYI